MKHIRARLGIKQAFVIFVGKLGVNGQPNRLTVIRSTGQSNGKVDTVLAAWPRDVLRCILIGRHHLLEQGSQLGLTKHAACFDVGQQMLKVPHPLRQSVHFAETLVHLLQAIGHLFETFTQPRLQGGLQFLIDRLAHLIEFGRIALLQLGQLRFQGAAHFSQSTCIGFRQLLHLQSECV